ncbi:MAG: hypothetical protein BGN92_09775 [Sphingobacteriales bacterium 41-5]|nr:MAG: hypothetical protein BGN92_09775 [Sphingobacteriales bacterium 41-5]
MSKINTTAKNVGDINSRKDNHFQAQYQRTFKAFFQPQTMKELSISTGIDRANICRYVRTMRHAGTIAVIRKKYCSITKHLAGVYTTNPALMAPKQPTLFDGDGGPGL